jgi:hypothetical protein
MLQWPHSCSLSCLLNLFLTSLGLSFLNFLSSIFFAVLPFLFFTPLLFRQCIFGDTIEVLSVCATPCYINF